MKKGQNYYKRIAARLILEKMDISILVDLYNKMAEEENIPIHIFDNSAMVLDEEVLPMRGAWDSIMAAMNGYWLPSDSFCYIRETQRGTELHSFSRIIDKDCPIYVSELLDWLERDDYCTIDNDVYTKDDYSQEVEDAFRMFAEEDEGFSPVGIGIFIGKNGGIALSDNWDNHIIDMLSE